jgi:hypothetical protein
MPANTTPIFQLTPSIGVGVIIATANTALDGTGTVGTLFTAESFGSRVDYVLIKYTGTSVATLARIFINNGGTNATASNNSLFAEQAITANTISQVAAQANTFVIHLNLALPPGYRILATIGTTVAAGLTFSAYGGRYN